MKGDLREWVSPANDNVNYSFLILNLFTSSSHEYLCRVVWLDSNLTHSDYLASWAANTKLISRVV